MSNEKPQRRRSLYTIPGLCYTFYWRCCNLTAVSHLLKKGVMLMGHRRWAKVLRFVVCFVIIVLMMLYIAPKAY